MDAVTLLRQQFETAHQWLEGTMADVTPEQAHWTPPGVANPLGASYAHVVVSEDLLVNYMVRQATPLCFSTWAERTGISEPMPLPGPDWVKYGEWARSVRVDLPAIREYAQAVYAATDEYVASLTSDDLDRSVDLSSVGMGERTLGWVLGNLVMAHAHDLMGEISCLKGLQGAKGYPF
ncbi:MAG TPA: DinB family protein [Chloroflexia bacterium]|nr:DinB family protein [Chloroflexia bacterium]